VSAREPIPGRSVAGPADRLEAIEAALDRVTDPELDQSVLDLGFIARIAVDGASVEIDYRLPTYWCSANFAWIMSEDMRSALLALPWIERAAIRLVDHFAASKINAGVARGERFGAALGSDTDIDLTALRETFRQKAFLGRMSAALDALRRAGKSDSAILALTIADLEAMNLELRHAGERRHFAGDRQGLNPPLESGSKPRSGFGEGAGAFPLADASVLPADARDDEPDLATAIFRYLELRTVYGGSATPADPAFRTLEGAALTPADLPSFLRTIRMARRGVEANGEMCRMMLRARLATPPSHSSTVIPAKAGTQ
jgi:metal-sulfur cluster biosynthetic enzyme